MNERSRPRTIVVARRGVFVNFGRGTPQRVKAAWALLVMVVGQVADWLGVVELQEGDKGYNDHSLMRMSFPAARWTAIPKKRWRKLHEAAAVPVGATIVKQGRLRAGLAVKHWSPPRGWSWVRLRLSYLPPGAKQLEQIDEEIYIGHGAAGTGRQAKNRPQWARRPLLDSWTLWRWRLKRRAHRAHKHGRHFTAAYDSNDPTFDIKAIHPKAVLLFQRGPDGALTVPAPGWSAQLVEHTVHEQPIEGFHPIHEFAYEFTRPL